MVLINEDGTVTVLPGMTVVNAPTPLRSGYSWIIGPEGQQINCKNCGENMRYTAAVDERGKPGTVYSTFGLVETRISQVCETCFDNITMNSEEENA